VPRKIMNGLSSLEDRKLIVMQERNRDVPMSAGALGDTRAQSDSGSPINHANEKRFAFLECHRRGKIPPRCGEDASCRRRWRGRIPTGSSRGG